MPARRPDPSLAAFPRSWYPILEDQAVLDAFCAANAAAGPAALPPQNLRYEALRLTSPDTVRVVIVGDGLFSHGGNAHGIGYSVPFSLDRRPLPASVRNFQSELATAAGLPACDFCDLTPIAAQGVLLLNRFWTLDRNGGPHANLGWDVVSRGLVRWLCRHRRPIVFVILGNELRDWVPDIPHHHVLLTAAAPSPREAAYGFFGAEIFQTVDASLDELRQPPIDWSAAFLPRALPPPALDRSLLRKIGDRTRPAIEFAR